MSNMSYTSNIIPNTHCNHYSFECYYCDKFTSTTDQRVGEKHVVLNHALLHDYFNRYLLTFW